MRWNYTWALTCVALCCALVKRILVINNYSLKFQNGSHVRAEFEVSKVPASSGYKNNIILPNYEQLCRSKQTEYWNDKQRVFMLRNCQNTFSIPDKQARNIFWFTRFVFVHYWFVVPSLKCRTNYIVLCWLHFHETCIISL